MSPSGEKLTPIAKFRKCMSTFLLKLKEWANRDQQKELDKFELKYDMGMNVNPRSALEYFIETIAPFADQILQGDAQYFLRENIEVDDEYNSLSEQIKLWWPEFDDQRRNYIKTQFKLLLMLGAIATKNQELKPIINSYRAQNNQLEY
jgi:hypothetical protein